MDNFLTEYFPLAIAIISILAFIVSIITELIKNIGLLKKLPTNILVLIISIIICISGYLAYTSYISSPIKWHLIIASFFSSFVVAYVATYGWEKMHLLNKRFKLRKNKESKTEENK